MFENISVNQDNQGGFDTDKAPGSAFCVIIFNVYEAIRSIGLSLLLTIVVWGGGCDIIPLTN